jgi:uncharacterized protein (DUF2147 family)
MNSKALMTTSTVFGAMILAAVIAMSGASTFTTIQPNAGAQATHGGSTNMMTDTMMKPENMMMTMGGENVTSSINLRNIISNAIGSQINVSLSNATTTAETSIGNNSHAVAARLGDVNGYLVYTIFVSDPNMNFNKVIVDPGNGQVLSSKQMSKEEHAMMHKGMMMGPRMAGPDISHTGQG